MNIRCLLLLWVISFWVIPVVLLAPVALLANDEVQTQIAHPKSHSVKAVTSNAPRSDALGELTSYLKVAATNNSQLQAAFSAWRAAVQKAPQVRALPDPQLKFSYYIEPIETRTGPQRMRYGISQKFPLAGKLSQREQIALRQADVLKGKADLVKLTIFRDVKQAYYELAYLEQAITITREDIALLDYMENVVRARYSAGNVPYASVLRTQVALDTLQERLVTLQDSRKPVAARLNAAMSQPLDTLIPPPSSIPVMELVTDDTSLKASLRENNPSLLAFDAQAKAAEAGMRLARSSYYPDITVGLDSIYTDSPRNNANAINSGDDPLIVSISINLPIWQNKLDAAVLENKETRLAVLKGKRGAEEKLLMQLELALYKYRDAGRRIALYRNTLIPKAEQVIEVTLEAFQNGAASSLELIDAEQTYFELQLASARALADQAEQIAQMEFLIGDEIPCKYHGYVMKNVSVPESELNTTIQ